MKFKLTVTSDEEEVFEKYKTQLSKLGFKKEMAGDIYSYPEYFININTLEELINLISEFEEDLFNGQIIISKDEIEIYNTYLY